MAYEHYLYHLFRTPIYAKYTKLFRYDLEYRTCSSFLYIVSKSTFWIIRTAVKMPILSVTQHQVPTTTWTNSLVNDCVFSGQLIFYCFGMPTFRFFSNKICPHKRVVYFFDFFCCQNDILKTQQMPSKFRHMYNRRSRRDIQCSIVGKHNYWLETSFIKLQEFRQCVYMAPVLLNWIVKIITS